MSSTPSSKLAEVVGIALQSISETAGSEFANHVGELLLTNPSQVARLVFLRKAVEVCKGGDYNELEKLWLTGRVPATTSEFIEHPYYLDMAGQIYPAIMEELLEINSGEYQEAVLTGAIGTGKTTIAIISTAYQLHLLSCYRDPHQIYGLDRSSELLFVFQSINATLSKSVDYARFKALIEKSPYFQNEFTFNKKILSELQFPNRIIVKPVSGQDTAAIGQNVFGGIIDEVNFMQRVEKSRQSVDGGTYDQAMALYNSIARRRKSRFMKKGKLPGLLCLVSSRRYPGQFTDIKEEEARKDIEETGRTGIFIYDKTTWAVKPEGTFSGEWFRIFIGDDTRRPRILQPEEMVHPADEALIREIPVEYKREFEDDVMNALRDIAGVATLAKHPFIQDTNTMAEAFGHHESVFSAEWIDFERTNTIIYPKHFFKPHLPRFAHIDLALSGDSCGFVVGTVSNFKEVARMEGERTFTEMLPEFHIDGALEIRPPPGGEIIFSKVRNILYKLKEMGLAVRWVSLDTYQSVDTLQILKQAGFLCGTKSVDTDLTPYEMTKAAFYDRRIHLPKHDKLRLELASLERDLKRNRIDHPPAGSKDISDALAGVVYGLTMRREIWGLYGVSILRVPESIRVQVQKPSGE